MPEQGPSSLPKPPRGMRRWLVGGLIAFHCCLLLLAGFSLAKSRQQYQDRAGVTAANLATVIQQGVADVIRKLDLMLQDLATEPGQTGQETLATLRHYARLSELDNLGLTDAEGRVTHTSSAALAPGLSLSGQPFFTRLRATPGAGLVVSRPVQGLGGPGWVQVYARRRTGADGAFLGIAFATVPLERFKAIFATVDVGAAGVIILRGRDLSMILASFPGQRSAPYDPGWETRVPSGPLVWQMQAGARLGTFQAVNPSDGVLRTVSFRQVSDYPLMVVVGLAARDFLAGWRHEAAETAVLLLGMILLTSIAGWQGLRAWRRRALVTEALRESENRFRHVAETLDEWIWEMDPKGCFRYASPAVYRILGYTPDELVGKVCFFDLFPPERKDELKAQILSVIQTRGRLLRYPSLTLHKNGTPVFLETTGSPMLDPQGRLIGYRGANLDVTAQRHEQEVQRQLEMELQHAQKLESLGSLAGGVAHDMNNVLAAILGLASTLQEKHADDEPLARKLGTIERAAARGAILVRHLTAFARKGLEAPKLLDLNELVRKEAELLEHTTLGRVALTLDLDPALPWVMGEASALENALINLCVNAVDAMPDGGALRLRTRAAAHLQAELSVEDTGQGMPPEVLARAMEPYFTTKPAGKGTGLGLAMVFGTLKAHGGSVEIRSVVGQGTQVLLRLPGLALERGAAPAPAPAPPGRDRRLRTLLVDDDELILTSVPAMLEHLGHEVTAVAGGQEALHHLQQGTGVQVVILDNNMPGLSGLETLTQLRTFLPDLPVLMATGRVDAAILARAEQDPFLSILAKPYNQASLRRALEATPVWLPDGA